MEVEAEEEAHWQAGVKVALDLASFEVVRAFWAELLEVLRGGGIEVCFCNEVRPLKAMALAFCTQRARAINIEIIFIFVFMYLLYSK